MSAPEGIGRRGFLGVAAAGILGGSLAPRLGWAEAQYDSRAGSGPAVAAPVKLGVASYSLRELSRSDAIAAIQTLGVTSVNIKSFHLPYEATPDELRAGRREFEQAGLEIVGGGTIYLQEEDDDHIRRHFEYARRCGMPRMVIGP
ncbi:MAG: hypothetical protein P8170_22730, partial [Gemmatimonadota bacterium]